MESTLARQARMIRRCRLTMSVLVAYIFIAGCACGDVFLGEEDSGVPRDGSAEHRPLEECGNGFDDDADGRIDNGCPCGPGEQQSCFSGAASARNVGMCNDGFQVCSGNGAEWGDWGDSACEGAVIAIATEECDGLDQDCDAAIDEGCPCSVGVTRECGESTNAPCKSGIQSCRDDGIWSGCEGVVFPTHDVCGDRIDNDCDGVIDFGCTCVPAPEQCRDRIDNDCDGRIDEPACRPDWPNTCREDDERRTSFERTLIELPARTWFEAPNSHLRDVCPDPWIDGRDCGIALSDNSGAYDSPRRRMLIWSGGFAGYLGNELYAFDLRTGTWSRITEPSMRPEDTSPAEFYNRDPLPDGQPVPRLSYDGVEFLSDVGLLWVHGGSQAIDRMGNRNTWVFDATAGWSERTEGYGGFNLASAYDAVSRRVLVHHSEALSIYDVENDAWAFYPLRNPPWWPRYGNALAKTAVVDPVRGLFWSVGGQCRAGDCQGTVLVWNIGTGMPVTDEWVTTGAGDYTNRAIVETYYPEQLFESGGGVIYYATAPGIDYDSAADDLVAWPNAGAPYALDLTTKEWTSGGDVGAPTAPGRRGTYGRWRYVAAYNVFILVNSVDENVYFYKHTSGCGPD
jgi:hypothetical protein